MEPFIGIAISIIVGLLVGGLSGMLGIGGGTIMVAVFRLGYGMEAVVSTATSLFTIIPTSISGMVVHIRNRTCIPKLGLAAGIAGAITSPFGVWLANISPQWLVMMAAAIVIGYSAITVLNKANKARKAARAMRDSALEGNSASEGEAASAGEGKGLGSEGEGMSARAARSGANPKDGLESWTKMPEIGTREMLMGAAIGLLSGVCSGYVGVGGGFIMVPMFMHLLKTPMKLTSGTSLIAIMILAISGTIAQAIYGNVDWLTGIFVSFGAIPGAIIGAQMMRRVPEVHLRYIFSAFLMVAAVMLVVNQFA